MNRRLVLVSSVIALAPLGAGCATFSDSRNVARVGDVTLSEDDFTELLTDLDAPDDQSLSADALRQEINTWIDGQIAGIAAPALDPAEVAARYDAGISTGTSVCVDGIIVADAHTADAVADQLANGASFAETYAAENIDPSIDASGGYLGCVAADQVVAAPDNEAVQTAATLNADNTIATASVPQGNPAAFVVLSFRPFAELGQVDVDAVSAGIDAANRLAAADVYVDPRYGTFDTASGQVVALG